MIRTQKYAHFAYPLVKEISTGESINKKYIDELNSIEDIDEISIEVKKILEKDFEIETALQKKTQLLISLKKEYNIELSILDKLIYELQKNNLLKNKYRTLALNFPTMIMQSGLAQAVGFLTAKGKPEHKTLLRHLATLLNYQANQNNSAIENLHKDILSSDLTKYQRLTRNALEATAWLKRYTQAMIVTDEDNHQNITEQG